MNQLMHHLDKKKIDEMISDAKLRAQKKLKTTDKKKVTIMEN